MESEKPNYGAIMVFFTKPSWAFLVLLFKVISIFSLQISPKSILPFPLFPVSGSSGPHFESSFETGSCAAFFGKLPMRKHVMSLKDFGGVGDGKTSNTAAFRKALDYMQRFSEKGGGQLNVPAGKWLTGSFNLTSNFTLFLEQGAVILGSQDPEEWPIVEPLPSYGRGRERLGGRHISLIHGNGLINVVITGNNGAIDGQGQMWWELWWNRTLNHTRGHLVELMNSQYILISNLTFQNSPFWTIHPIYCSNVVIKGMTVLAPLNAPNTDGIDPDSSTNVCIEDCYIESGDDLVAVKSGWDQYGIRMARPSSNIKVRRISGTTPTCSGVGIGSEMSGGIFNVTIEDMHVWNSAAGVRIKTDKGRGGYIENITISNITMEQVKIPIRLSRGSDDHPDDGWDPKAMPKIKGIFFSNIVSLKSSKAPVLAGIHDASFEGLCFKNVTLLGLSPTAAWHCEFVSGCADAVFPLPCPHLQNNGSSTCCS
ncbi:Pectin lyase-like superfamily protein isoform 2 [Hibiscus syriacus]|uniref:Pectin lyase-like superfamily protein isoform 2 n=1 Tax=Hibiscus syriacus TaxID=106335 RepID=A0A6A2ZG47_HIBSY|nr:probable polygalacturonase [Hibiscus syriacus]KAE8690082.1 Pectin lyase-like superfamily protein isoform 2 [Hibiscus syriacus]